MSLLFHTIRAYAFYNKKTAPSDAGKPAATGSTTESEDGFDDDYTTPKSRVTSAVKGAATQFDALRKGMPDLFQGAREAYKFLQQLNGFLDVWEGRLAATADADDDE